MKSDNNTRQRRSRSGTIVLILVFCAQILSSVLFPSCVTVQSSLEEPYYVTEYTTENRTELYTETVPIVKSVPHKEVLQPYILWSNPQLLFNQRKSIWYYGYDLSGFPPHEKQQIKLEFFKQQFYEYLAVSVFDMDQRGQILAPQLISDSDNISSIVVKPNWITSQEDISTFNTWFKLADMKLTFAHFLGGRTDLFSNSATAYPVELNTRGSREIAVLIYGPTDPQNRGFSATLEWSENVTEYVTRTAERSVPVQVEHRVIKQKSVLQSR
ncbi:MAG: hypothetical protein NTZ34_00355 [Chloroflexi bacterium]|nr:hypothetical protein [Chloroflexota bacterium]